MEGTAVLRLALASPLTNLTVIISINSIVWTPNWRQQHHQLRPLRQVHLMHVLFLLKTNKGRWGMVGVIVMKRLEISTLKAADGMVAIVVFSLV